MGGRNREAGNPFWDFSLAVYGREGVATACLALQDRHGLDVNLALYCAWAGHRGRALSAVDLARLTAVARSWQADVVAPLRAIRRHLKALTALPESAAEQLRTRVKEIELEAEAVEQRMLYEALPVADGRGAPAIAGGNMVAYLESLGIAPDATDVADLAAIARGCFPDLPPLQAVWAVTG